MGQVAARGVTVQNLQQEKLHGGDWREAALPRRAAELGSPVRAMLESFHPGSLPPQHSYVSDGGGQLMVTAVKGSEDGTSRIPDLLVRAVETTGRPALIDATTVW